MNKEALEAFAREAAKGIKKLINDTHHIQTSPTKNLSMTTIPSLS